MNSIFIYDLNALSWIVIYEFVDCEILSTTGVP